MYTDWFGGLFFSSAKDRLSEFVDINGNLWNPKKIQKCSMLKNLVTESFLKNKKTPFIIYNGTHSIKHLDKLFVTPLHKQTILNDEVCFYFFEPLTHYVVNDYIDAEYAPHILKIDNEMHELTKIRCLELDSLQRWVEQHHIKNLKIYCTDYKSWEHYQELYPQLKLFSLDLFVAWWTQRIAAQDKRYGVFEFQNINQHNITKKFWSGAWRYDPSRHFITAFLAGKNLIDNNNVSFYFKITNLEMTRKLWFGWKEFSFRHPRISSLILRGNTVLQERVPLYFSVKNPIAILNDGDTDPELDMLGHNIRHTQNPTGTYFESFCAIVQESRVTQPWPNISEKTLNAIKNRRPFLMCAAPGTLSMLKEMGFKTFDEYWPEDYDNIVSNKDRLARICEIIEYIDSFTIDELRNMYQSIVPILEHNVKNIKNIPQFYNNVNTKILKNFDKTTD